MTEFKEPQMERTCLNRFLGNCPDCKTNYDLDNRPNNLDCKRYVECHIRTFVVEESKDKIGNEPDIFKGGNYPIW